MKLKNSKALALKPVLLIVFPVCCLILTALRAVEVATLIDAETGFYTQSSFLIVLFNVLAALSCAFFAVYAYLSKEADELQPAARKSIPLFVFSLLFGIALFYDAIRSLAQYSQLKTTTVGGLKVMMSSGALPLLLEAFFALLSGVFFFFVASGYIKGTNAASKHKIFALMPTGWVAFRMVHLFVRKISFVKVSDLFFELAACAFMILFFLAFAQVVCGVYSTGMAWRLFAFGLPAALLALVLQLPRLVFSFVSAGSHLNANHPFLPADLLFALFAFALCGVMLAPITETKTK